MSPRQVWSRDSAGNPVYWTGTEWIQPHWNRDSAGIPIFWSPQHQQWLRVEINPLPASQPSPANDSNHGTSNDSKDSGKRPGPGPGPAPSHNATGISQTQAAGNTSSVPGLDSAMASLKVGPSSLSGNRPTLKWRTDDASGITEYVVSSQGEGVHSKFQKGPANRITDPHALAKGLASSKYFKGVDDSRPGTYERLDERFKVRKQSRRFFKFGRVFMMLHPEPAGEFRSAVTPVTRDARYGEGFYISPRRFVVVIEGETSCTAIAIWTYSYQGVAKAGVQKSHHAIVFSGRNPPSNVPTSGELPCRGEKPMRPQKIRVNMHDPEADALHEMSRINFAKMYTIEHNVKVRDLGEVNPKSMADLWSVFWNVQTENAERHGPQRQLPSSLQAGPSSRGRVDSVSGPNNQESDRDDEDKESDESESDDSEDEDDDGR